MKTRRAVQLRRRFRLFLGWALILSVAVGELWVLGNLVNGFDQASSAAQRQVVPHMAEWAIAIR